jgi:hypothetical protein
MIPLLAAPEWSPVRAYADADGRWHVDWAAVGRGPFGRPFFDLEVEAAFTNPARLLFRPQTPVEALPALAEAIESLPVGGLIFHASRCGSTLLAQLLAASRQHTVLSEPCALDNLLGANRTGDDAVDRWLPPLLRLLARRRRREERRVFLKLDCWHILQFDSLRHVLPQVPWIFLYRDPVEILASHDRHRGLQMMPGALPPEFLQVPDPPPTIDGLATYSAQVLGRLFEAALAAIRLAPHTGRLVRYSDLTGPHWPDVLAHFGVTVPTGDVHALEAVRSRNAKDPDHPFSPDSEQKQASASEAVRSAAATHARPAYELLEAATTAASRSNHLRSQSLTLQSMTRCTRSEAP